MQRKFMIFSLFISALLVPALVSAQDPNDLIVLNDSTPAIDVVINPSPDTTGVVALEVDNASVIITDAVGNIVFETTDPDIEALEFHFAPNAGQHTLTVERLPGAPQAYSRIVSLAEMSASDVSPTLVEGNTLAQTQEADYPLNVGSPSSTVDFTITEEQQYGTITASFPGAPVTAQLVEVEENRTLATLYGSLIDGVRFTVDDGNYQLALLNNNPEQQTVATVSYLPASETDFETMVTQAEDAQTTTMTDTNTSNSAIPQTNPTSDCTLAVTASSVNLRSGPGTGYSVLEYAFRGDILPVGGENPGTGWVLVGTETGSGWMATASGMLSGTCDSLTAYDIPYREAPAPSVIIQQESVPVYHDDDDDEYEEYEDHDDDEHEGEYEEHEDHDDD